MRRHFLEDRREVDRTLLAQSKNKYSGKGHHLLSLIGIWNKRRHNSREQKSWEDSSLLFSGALCDNLKDSL